MIKKWINKEAPDAGIAQTLREKLSVPPILSTLLVQRGIENFEDAKKFFRPDLNDLHDPFLMKDMDKAVNRLGQALRDGEKVLIYGDYDVDGTTAVTLVFSFLKNLGLECDYYIPDRYTEGYGFSFASVEYAKEHALQLIITLDCGIRDGEKIKLASKYGIDVIVCDHHNPAELPEAYAVLDPKREDCPYPFKGLSGCGVGFKMLQAFSLQHDLPMTDLFSYLDLLTISISADIVPIVDENRIFAFHGLKQLANERRPGISAMLEQASFKKNVLTITDVVFILSPRINAAGRIFSGKRAVELLLCDDLEEAKILSKAIEANNKERKGLDKKITEEALNQVKADEFYETSFTTVVVDKTWHKGVVGIVASRVVEAFYKPAIVLVKDNEKMSGSARSIDGIDLFEALGECSGYLEQFGGHAMAAGLSLKAENFLSFREKFDSVVARMLSGIKSIPKILYDAEIHFSDIDDRFYRILKQLAPFGPGNMSPVFLVKNVSNARYTRYVGDGNVHLKLHVRQNQDMEFEMDGIAFYLGHWFEALDSGNEVDLLFTIEENEWNGRITLQMNVKDIRLSETLLQN